ncbi:MAG: hypothetical protein JJU21_13450 [Salinarimonas sp.]|nr:hypothetical protein [Salinarimonas sp.]
MPLFRVRFLKRVCDATGHETMICQRSFEVQAEAEDQAFDKAEKLFSAAERATNWRLRADSVETETLEAAADRR